MQKTRKEILAEALALYAEDNEQLMEDLTDLVNNLVKISPRTGYEWVCCFLPEGIDFDEVFSYAERC